MRLLAPVLVLAALAAPGCFGFVPTRAPLVVVDDVLEIPERLDASGDFGPHCGDVRLDRERPALELLRHEGPRPEAVLVRAFEGWQGMAVSFSTDGLKALKTQDPSAGWVLGSPLEGGPDRLLAIRLEGADVLVEDKRLRPGESAQFHFSYELPPRDVRVNETLRVTNLGEARLTTKGSFGACM